ncbi:MAG: SCO family protein, partial [Candidatus Binatia bacterium]
PGSYRLPVIQRVGDHPLIDAAGTRTTLYGLKGRRLAVVAFIYTSCADADGCPLAQAVLLKIDRDLAADAELRDQTLLVSVSFDPERDTPEHLFQVRNVYRPQADWRFATSPDAEALRLMLEDFGQSVAKLEHEDGRWSGLYRHVLKVFLLDRENGVRNVYSSGFFDRDLVLNDLRTLVRGDTVSKTP